MRSHANNFADRAATPNRRQFEKCGPFSLNPSQGPGWGFSVVSPMSLLKNSGCSDCARGGCSDEARRLSLPPLSRSA
jgi:hypothetical protein